MSAFDPKRTLRRHHAIQAQRKRQIAFDVQSLSLALW
jgi:hypothetical protein